MLTIDQITFSAREKALLIHKIGNPKKPVTKKSIPKIMGRDRRKSSQGEMLSWGMNTPEEWGAEIPGCLWGACGGSIRGGICGESIGLSLARLRIEATMSCRYYDSFSEV